MTLLTLSGQARAARATMISLLETSTEAVAGYPVASLMRGCWRPSCAGVSVRGSQIAARVLQAWIRQLDGDLALLSPSACPSIERIRRQTSEAQALLTQLLTCVVILLDPMPSAMVLATDRAARAPLLGVNA